MSARIHLGLSTLLASLQLREILNCKEANLAPAGEVWEAATLKKLTKNSSGWNFRIHSPPAAESIACPGCDLIDPVRINVFNKDGTVRKRKLRKPRVNREDQAPRPKRPPRKKKEDPNQTLLFKER